jgi:dipeptidyl aminopeptidase/acylaminoacyl peptidase
LSKPLYFEVYDRKSGDQGVARRDPRSGRTRRLHMEAGWFQVEKAADADVFAAGIATNRAEFDYYLMSPRWSRARHLTDANPRQREIEWGPPSIHLVYTTAHGDRLTGALFPPIGYRKGHKVPLILPILYEADSVLHSFSSPYETHQDRWLRKGYAIMLLEVRPRFNEAGRAVVEAVSAALEAADATGIIDRSRVGVIGHSHGGYDVYYLVSHSDLVQAAVAESGYTDLISGYGGARLGPIASTPESVGIEHDQEYLAGPWWENWSAYLENSPLFSAQRIRTPLLMVHGDRDPAVPFSQAVELFNTLRRMGNRSTVLLHYVGEDHSLMKDETMHDLHRRIEEFFDHILKREPAPRWWADEQSIDLGEVPVPDRPSLAN